MGSLGRPGSSWWSLGRRPLGGVAGGQPVLGTMGLRRGPLSGRRGHMAAHHEVRKQRGKVAQLSLLPRLQP